VNSNIKPIIFTHIPKTAGSSFKQGVLFTNFKEEEIYLFQGLKKLIFSNKRNYKIFIGHFPYGVHRFIPAEVQYFTFLRQPIERAISHYYWVKQSKYPTYVHPEWELHEKILLKDFFAKRNLDRFNTHYFRLIDNLQTRYIAGLGNGFYGNNSKKMLDKAKSNLEKKYKIFGLQERYEDSIQLFMKHFHLINYEHKLEKNTFKKPSIKELDSETYEVLMENHKLDQELYLFGKEIFKTFQKP
jgi:hypothetical protein